MREEMIIFSGRSHPELAATIAKNLRIRLGKSTIHSFKNDNIMVRIHDNVREKDVFLIQTSCPPVSDRIIEMLIFIDALKHASAGRITAVIPYFPYCRSDKKDEPRISIAARLMADLIQTAGANRVLTMDLHAPQIQGFFRIPVDQLLAAPIFFNYIKQRLFKKESMKDFVIVMGDAGAAKQFNYYHNELKLPVVIVDKVRVDHLDRPIIRQIIGDFYGKNVLMIDDEIATGGTLIESAEFLKKNGARKIIASAVHPIFCEDAVERLVNSSIEKVIVANTVPVAEKVEKYASKFEILDVAPLFSKAISAIHNGNSLSKLFPRSVRRKR